jgi:hypothetical protein
MSKEKNKNTFRVAALLLVACLISSVMLSGTFAKYTSEYAGQDTALVARWSFTSNILAEATAAETAADIYLPIWEHDYVTNIYEQHEGKYLIAPGIEGEFTIDFAYDADVDAYLIFNFTKSGNYDSEDEDDVADEAAPVPIQYSLDNNFETVYYSLDALENAIIARAVTDSTSTITPVDGNGTYVITDTATVDPGFDGEEPSLPVIINQTVYWRWPFEDDEEDETLHNTATNAEKRTLAGFPGTGAAIGGTDYKEWTDADDTAIGNISKTLDRGSYILNLVISATQIEPE